MKFKDLWAFRINPSTGKQSTKLDQFSVFKTSICNICPVEEDHFLVELTNGVVLKVPGEYEVFKRYLEEDDDKEEPEESTAARIKRRVGIKAR